MGDLILAIDQGTTGTTVLIIDHAMNVLSRGYAEFPQIYPKPGWVEHNPEDIWDTTKRTIVQALSAGSIDPSQIAAIGITNQRETSIVWSRKTGVPYHNAIVWQCRRTADFCQALKERGMEQTFRDVTGLVLDPYFSGTKLAWFMENVPEFATAAQNGDAAFGTVDTFLVWRLTAGQAHVTDVSNASRTLMFSLADLNWDEELVDILGVPTSVLPKVCSSSEVYGTTSGLDVLPDGIPVAGIAGDQQAALFGQACFDPGMAKCTYGTGSFMLLNTGNKIIPSTHQMLTTVGWKLGDEVVYALEGSCFISGAAVQWLRDGMSLFESSPHIEALAAGVKDSGGVVFVPALAGLGAPHWNPKAKGVIWGITRGTTKAHIARATLEAIALQNFEVLKAMQEDYGQELAVLRVDGGASENNLLMQFQADILGVNISRPTMVETTALGAALLAGLAVGLWQSKDEVTANWKEERNFAPQMSSEKVAEHMNLWQQALGRV
jgi:glycerol kinase